MRTVTVALLATLLLAGCLIVALVGLTIHLTIQLRALRVSARATEGAESCAGHSPPTTQPEEDLRPLRLRKPTKSSRLTDASDPNWRVDAIYATSSFSTCGDRAGVGTTQYRQPGVESWATEILKDIGYKGVVSVPAILNLLRQWESYRNIIRYITRTIVLERLSLEGDPEVSLLPFTPEVHLWLRDFYKSLEGVKLTPELSSVFSKIPFLFADEYAEQHASEGEGTRRTLPLYNKKNFAYLNNRLAELFSQVEHPEWKISLPNVRGEIVYMQGNGLDQSFLNDAVQFHLRMWASHQRFELRWGNETTADGRILDATAALYSHAGPDGLPLSEPKIWQEPQSWDLVALGAKVDGEQYRKQDGEQDGEQMGGQR